MLVGEERWEGICMHRLWIYYGKVIIAKGKSTYIC